MDKLCEFPKKSCCDNCRNILAALKGKKQDLVYPGPFAMSVKYSVVCGRENCHHNYYKMYYEKLEFPILRLFTDKHFSNDILKKRYIKIVEPYYKIAMHRDIDWDDDDVDCGTYSKIVNIKIVKRKDSVSESLFQ